MRLYLLLIVKNLFAMLSLVVLGSHEHRFLCLILAAFIVLTGFVTRTYVYLLICVYH